MRRQFILAKLLWRLVPGRLPFGPSHIGGLGDRRLLRIVVEDRAGDHRTARRPLPRREVIKARPVSGFVVSPRGGHVRRNLGRPGRRDPQDLRRHGAPAAGVTRTARRSSPAGLAPVRSRDHSDHRGAARGPVNERRGDALRVVRYETERTAERAQPPEVAVAACERRVSSARPDMAHRRPWEYAHRLRSDFYASDHGACFRCRAPDPGAPR